MPNYSYRLLQNLTCFLPCLVDREVAKQVSLGKTKLSYHICYGIAPYFGDMFIDSLKVVPFYSLSFDEFYNNVLKNGKRIYMSDIRKILKIKS